MADGQVELRHTAVVGKIDRASPQLSVKIQEVNFNPFWTVPTSIIRKDLIPKMQKEPDYLTKNNIRIFTQKGEQLQPEQVNWQSDEAMDYRFTQDPGDLNSMGSMRLNMPNKDGVYMHDTPSKGLFGENARFHSSGCVRVQNVRDLAEWLLARNARLGAPADRRRHQVRRAHRRQDQGAGRGLLGLHHGLGGRPGHRPVPRRHLQSRRCRPNRRPSVSAGSPELGEVFLEFHPIGGSVKVSAIHAATGVEVSAVAPANAAKADLQRLILKKLEARLVREGKL